MQELIHISTNGQGSDVVSARELHEFLEVKTRFNDWIKNRIIKYGFLENLDYVEVEGFTQNLVKPLEGGRPTTDYALTLDMAKELSMVERTSKGKEARQYFIDAEKALRQVVVAPAPALPDQVTQLLAQTTQLLMNQQQQANRHEQQIDQLRADVESIMNRRQLPRPIAPVASHIPRPHVNLRQTLTRIVNEYCGSHGVMQAETWTYLYRLMHEVYGVNVRRLTKLSGESYIDTIERYGHLDKLYNLAVSQLEYLDE